METHSHDHSGVLDLTWDRFGVLAKELAERIRREFEPETVVGIAKGGVIPAVVISSAYCTDFFPIKLTTRRNEKVVRTVPEILVPPTAHLSGRKVLLVDDISITGRTLKLAREEIAAQGAAEVRTATLLVHGDSVAPDWFALRTDDLVLLPWDREVLRQGQWQIHPEYREQMPPGEAPA